MAYVARPELRRAVQANRAVLRVNAVVRPAVRQRKYVAVIPAVLRVNAVVRPAAHQARPAQMRSALPLHVEPVLYPAVPEDVATLTRSVVKIK